MNIRTKLTAIIFLSAALNVPFALADPTRWWNWLAMGFCLGLGVAHSVMSGDARDERYKCLMAVAVEPELPGGFPDAMWKAIAGDRDAAAEAMRIAVRQTKDGIRKRIEGAP